MERYRIVRVAFGSGREEYVVQRRLLVFWVRATRYRAVYSLETGLCDLYDSGRFCSLKEAYDYIDSLKRDKADAKVASREVIIREGETLK